MHSVDGSTHRRHPILTRTAPYLLAALACLAAAGVPGAQNRSERTIGPGVRLLRWSQPDGPHALQCVEVDAGQPFVRFGISLGRGDTLGLEPLSRQAERLSRPDRYAIAGVNGDFFLYPNARQPGIPTNAVVLDDEVVRTPFNRSCLILPAAGPPAIRILRARGEVILPDGSRLSVTGVNHPRAANDLILYTPRFGASTRTDPSGTEAYLALDPGPLRPGATHRARVRAVQVGVGDAPLQPGIWILSGAGTASAAVKRLALNDELDVRIDFEPALAPGDLVLGGGPRIVRDGRVSVEVEGGSLRESFAQARHPRSAIGYGGGKLYLLVVDGRQPGYSLGMTLAEVGQVLVDLGCTDAVNLDGGGSSTLWVRGSVVNRPSDGRERPVANGLLVYSTAPVGPPVRALPDPPEIAALAGAETAVGAAGEDQYFNPVPLPGDGVVWSVPETLGEVRDGRFRARTDAVADAGSEFAAGSIRLSAGGASAAIPVRVYPRPARLEVLPAAARVEPGGRALFRARAFDREGRPLLMPAAVQWEASPEVGRVDAEGSLAGAPAPARGMVTVTVNGVRATAQVEVTKDAARLLEDFESAADWKSSVTPAGTTGAARVAEGTARSGRRALKLEYDFSTGAGTRAVYALASRGLGHPRALRVWVHGDGQNAWLRARVRDAARQAHLMDVARRVDWSGSWREIRLPLPSELPGPLTLEAIYVVEPDAALRPRGALWIDDLIVEE